MKIYRGYDVLYMKDGQGNMNWQIMKNDRIECWQSSEEAALKWIDTQKKKDAQIK